MITKLKNMDKTQLLQVCNIMNIKMSKKKSKLDIVRHLIKPLYNHTYKIFSLPDELQRKISEYNSLADYTSIKKAIESIDIHNKRQITEFKQHSFDKMTRKYGKGPKILETIFRKIEVKGIMEYPEEFNISTSDEYKDMKIILIMLFTSIQIKGDNVVMNSENPEYKYDDGIDFLILKYFRFFYGTWTSKGGYLVNDNGSPIGIREGDETGSCCGKCEISGIAGFFDKCVGTNCSHKKCTPCDDYSSMSQYKRNCKSSKLPTFPLKHDEYMKYTGSFVILFNYLHDFEPFNALIEERRK